MKLFFSGLFFLFVFVFADTAVLAQDSDAAPLAQDADPGVDFSAMLSFQQGLQYSRLAEYKLNTIQYDGSLAAALEIYFTRARLGISPRIAFLYTVPPAITGPFGFRGDFGYGLGMSIDYHIIPDRFQLSLAGDFRFLRYWYTSIIFISPQLGIEAAVALPGLSATVFKDKIQVMAKLSWMYRFRPDADFSTSANLGLVFRF